MKACPASFTLLTALAIAAVAAASPRPSPQPPPPDPARAPRVDLDRLERSAPGWAVAESTGDGSRGSLVVERAVWPLFYVHWFPLKETAGRSLGASEAAKVVAALWVDIALDEPLKGTPIALPAHQGLAFETIRSHGQIRSRYVVWACPESSRLFVADANLHLNAGAPERLFELQRDMVLTIKCHQGAAAESFGHLGVPHADVPAEIALEHATNWVPVPGYRPQSVFGGSEWGRETPPNSRERGQLLVLEADAMRRLFVSWGPKYDFPMSYEVLKQKVEDHFRERSVDIVLTQGNVSNDVWFMDGAMRPGPYGRAVPPTRMHKFRAWMWTQGSVTYFAVGDVGGIRFGRANVALPLEAWVGRLEEMYQAIVP
ncbi:MAG TPA: hypothetical protein VJV23_01290 [Candidatus Polarisedimenticolia bacterium]|nr:hypothetical protein [Candidatus Polarisedimenticolia bacterium]